MLQVAFPQLEDLELSNAGDKVSHIWGDSNNDKNNITSIGLFSQTKGSSLCMEM